MSTSAALGDYPIESRLEVPGVSGFSHRLWLGCGSGTYVGAAAFTMPNFGSSEQAVAQTRSAGFTAGSAADLALYDRKVLL